MAGKSKLVEEALRVAREGLEGLAKSKGKTPQELLGGFANQKPRVPFEEWRYEFEPTADLLASKEFNPESLKPGDVIIPLVGDRTSTGRKITSIAGQPLEVPAITEGGPDYMRGPSQQSDKSVWASGKGVITGLEGRIQNALRESEAKGYKDPNVYGSYVAMGPQSGDFSTHTAEAVMGMLPGSKIKRADVKEFDAKMREKFADWPGLQSPKAADYVINANAGEHRKAFLDVMDSAYWRDKGFPEVSLARYATTTPELVASPTEAAGYNIARITPSEKPEVITKVHRSYPSTMHGEYVGGLPSGLTRDELFTQFSRAYDVNPAEPGRYVNAKRRAFNMNPNAFQLMEGEDIEDLIRKVTALKNEYADGGEVYDDDDINDALRIAKDNGGATGGVFMTDANGIDYDAQGNVVPQQERAGVIEAGEPENYEAEVKPFIDYAMTPMDRPGMPSEPDLVDAMRVATQVAASGQPTDARGDANFGRMRTEAVRRAMGAPESGASSPYQGPFSYNPSDMAGFVNTVLDFSPVALGEIAHDVPYEAVRTGDYGSAAAEGGLNALMTAPGMQVAGAAGRGAINLVRKSPKIAAGLAGTAALAAPDEAEAGPARWFSKAMEVAQAIPMQKMTGEQALAMLRKGVSPEELRWTGTDAFLSGQKSVTKDDLLAHLAKNRVQRQDIVRGGSKPTNRDYVVPSEAAIASMKARWDELAAKKREINQQVMLAPSERRANYDQLMEEQISIDNEMDKLHGKMIDDTIAEMGGLGVPLRFGPGSKYGEKYVTPGGTDYRETLIALPPDESVLVEWPVVGPDGVQRGRYYDRESAQMMADRISGTVLDPINTKVISGYYGNHWSEPNVVAHIRSQMLTATPEGANRPFKVYNMDETQSDMAQDARKYGLKMPEAERKAIRDRIDQIREERAKYIGSTDLDERSKYDFLAKEEDDLLKKYNQNDKKAVKDAPYISSTQGWTDLAIKKAIDDALDSGAEYFTFTPGTVQADRYSLARDLSHIEYEPADEDVGKGVYQIIAVNKQGKDVIDSYYYYDEIEETFGKEIAEKIKNDTGRKMEDRPYRDWRILDNEQIKAKGDKMVDYYENIYKKRVLKVIKDATGKKASWERIPVDTADGIRMQDAIRIDDLHDARFSDFNKGGSVTGGKSYDNDASVAHALALTREY